MTNNDFELSALEEARLRFQANISSIIEIEAELDRKIKLSETKGKDVIFIDTAEAELLTKHLRQICSQMLGAYDVMNHTSKQLIFQNRFLKAQTEPSEPTPGGFAERIKKQLES